MGGAKRILKDSCFSQAGQGSRAGDFSWGERQRELAAVAAAKARDAGEVTKTSIWGQEFEVFHGKSGCYEKPRKG